MPKTPKFIKTIREGDVVVTLEHDNDVVGAFMDIGAGDIYLDVSKPLSEKQLLNAFSQAYRMGYEEAVSDSKEAVVRVLYERKTDPAPKPRFAKIVNFKI